MIVVLCHTLGECVSLSVEIFFRVIIYFVTFDRARRTCLCVRRVKYVGDDARCRVGETALGWLQTDRLSGQKFAQPMIDWRKVELGPPVCSRPCTSYGK